MHWLKFGLWLTILAVQYLEKHSVYAVFLSPKGSLLGEVTEKMALAVSRADAVRILIPMNRCENLVAGISDLNAGALIADAVCKLQNVVNGKST